MAEHARVPYDFSERPPRQPKYPAYCFAFDYATKEPITINTYCHMGERCEECIPEWWMAL